MATIAPLFAEDASVTRCARLSFFLPGTLPNVENEGGSAPS
jgi:hypothetical protein